MAERVLVAGAGIAGVTTAWLLLRDGWDVTLLDAAPGAGLGASHANGGQLAHDFVRSLASPASLGSLVAGLFRRDPSITISPWRAGPRILPWAASFLGECRPGRWQANSLALLELAARSRRVLAEVMAEISPDIDYRADGILTLYRSAAAMERTRRLMETAQVRHRLLTPGECRRAEPGLGLPAFHGGILGLSSATGNCRAMIAELLARCGQQRGFRFEPDSRVFSLERQAGRVTAFRTSHGPRQAGLYVLATGAGTAMLAREAGVRLPVIPVRGYSCSFPLGTPPRHALTDEGQHVVVARLGQTLRVAGILDICGTEEQAGQGRFALLRAAARALLPAAADYDAPVHVWSGLRPLTPSSLPFTGRAGADNLYLNAGHGMYGWTLACGSAQLLLELLRKETGTAAPAAAGADPGGT